MTIFSCSVILKESQHTSVRAFLLLWSTELLEGWQVNHACLTCPTKYRLWAGNCHEVHMDPNGAFLVSFPCDLLANYTCSHQRLLYDLWLQNHPPTSVVTPTVFLSFRPLILSPSSSGLQRAQSVNRRIMQHACQSLPCFSMQGPVPWEPIINLVSRSLLGLKY